jgi:hypothetical protein
VVRQNPVRDETIDDSAEGLDPRRLDLWDTVVETCRVSMRTDLAPSGAEVRQLLNTARQLAGAAPNHKILLENDKVRVLDVYVATGEVEPVHSHRWPSVLHILTAGDFIDCDGGDRAQQCEQDGPHEPGSLVPPQAPVKSCDRDLAKHTRP